MDDREHEFSRCSCAHFMRMFMWNGFVWPSPRVGGQTHVPEYVIWMMKWWLRCVVHYIDTHTLHGKLRSLAHSAIKCGGIAGIAGQSVWSRHEEQAASFPLDALRVFCTFCMRFCADCANIVYFAYGIIYICTHIYTNCNKQQRLILGITPKAYDILVEFIRWLCV